MWYVISPGSMISGKTNLRLLASPIYVSATRTKLLTTRTCRYAVYTTIACQSLTVDCNLRPGQQAMCVATSHCDSDGRLPLQQEASHLHIRGDDERTLLRHLALTTNLTDDILCHIRAPAPTTDETMTNMMSLNTNTTCVCTVPAAGAANDI